MKVDEGYFWMFLKKLVLKVLNDPQPQFNGQFKQIWID